MEEVNEDDLCLLSVQVSPGKGRGVFTLKRISEGQLIESSPAIALQVSTTEIDAYVYRHEYECEDGETEVEFWFGGGLTSFYNHDESPNAEFDLIEDEDLGAMIEIRALREIGPDEEITISYGEKDIDFNEWGRP